MVVLQLHNLISLSFEPSFFGRGCQCVKFLVSSNLAAVQLLWSLDLVGTSLVGGRGFLLQLPPQGVFEPSNNRLQKTSKTKATKT